MSENNKHPSAGRGRKRAGWFRRLFFGGSKTLADDMLETDRYGQQKIEDVEVILSPGKQIVKGFLEKKYAVVALVVVVVMFLIAFVGPLFMPKYFDAYSENTQQSIYPTLSMMKMPKELQKDVKQVSSYGPFTVGLSGSGKVYVWGCTQIGTTGFDVSRIPEDVQKANIVMVAAGIDHIIAIDDKGKIYGWGNYKLGQYGRYDEFADTSVVLPIPQELYDNGVDVSKVKKLTCGYQSTAILMEDGTIYAWGNDGLNATNLSSVIKHGKKESKLVKLAFTNDGLYGIDEDGNFVPGKSSKFNTITIQDENGQNKVVDIFEYIGDRKIVDIAATGGAIALVTDDGELIVAGMKEATPVIPEGDTIKHVSGGTRHFTLVTEQGRVYAWGQNFRKQCEVPADLQEAGAVDTVFSSGFQNYAFKDGKFVEAWGLKGYVFGTDDMGRDVFNRLMNGGKMTMTIGAVAVIVSTIIGIIVGCISGYFGGWVDILLMRVTEIVGAIPFLPFALVLSAILQSSDLHENTRIFIIMLILGLLSWTGLAKLIRGQILAEREKEFVTAARSMGVKEGRIAFKHILPNVISVILVSVTLDFAGCMLTESSLSYLGFGVQLPRPTWGNMLDGSRNALVIQSYWWRWVFPALFLSIVVICINIIGDTLREVLDPKSEVDK